MTDLNFAIETDPKDATVHALFEQQAQKTPNQIAVEYSGETLTYKALNDKADELADCLREQKISPNDVVALFIEKSARIVIGVLGILKSGAAYMPIDPNDPPQRVEFMLSDSNARVIVTEAGLVHRFKGFEGPCLFIDDVNEVANVPDIQTSVVARQRIWRTSSTRQGQRVNPKVSQSSTVALFISFFR